MLRNVVVVAEVALSFVLLIGSGLMVRSFLELQRIDPGFDSAPPADLPHHWRAPRHATRRSVPRGFATSQTNSQRIPGVQSVTAATPFPLAGPFFPIRWGLAPAAYRPEQVPGRRSTSSSSPATSKPCTRR